MSSEITERISRFSSTESGFLVFGLTLISFVATAANLCVFIAYVKNQSLQTTSNWLILSLAVADTWIGAVSINFYTVYLVYGYWPMGKRACNFWLSTDYWCSQASVVHLLVISVDRYLVIRFPLTYRAMRTNLRLKCVIFLVWFVSFVLWVPWIIAYRYIVGKQDVPDDQCYIQFLNDSIFLTVFTALSAYYIPLLVMVFLYIRIYTFLQKRKRTLNRVGTPRHVNDSFSPSLSHISVTQKNSCLEFNSIVNINEGMSSYGIPKKKYKNYSRAKKLLILIILAYAITWLPYNVFAVISPFCSTCVTAPLWDFGYLFCYVNSLVNPFCYAFGNRRFKEAFKSMFVRKLKKPDKKICCNASQKI